MFRRSRKACKGGVDLHLQWIFNIAGHHRAAEEMDVGETFDKTRRAVNVGKPRSAIGPRFIIEIFRRSAAGADMNPVFTKNEVMFWPPAVKHHPARERLENAFHQCPRKCQPPLRRHKATGSGHEIDNRWRRAGNACFLEDRQSRQMDSLKIGISKKTYLTANSRKLRRRRVGSRPLGTTAAPLTRRRTVLRHGVVPRFVSRFQHRDLATCRQAGKSLTARPR